MAVPIGFEQDPEMPPGVGRFHFDDGESIYGEQPELAMQLSDQRTAQAPPEALGFNPDVGQWSNPRFAPAPQQVADVPPIPNAPNAPPAAPQPIPNAQPGQPPRIVPAGAPEQPQQAAREPFTPEEQAYINRPVGGAPGVDPRRMRAQGVPVPRTIQTTVKSTTPAPPIPDEMRERYAAAQHKYEQTQFDILDEQQARAAYEAANAKRQAIEATDETLRLQRAQQTKEDKYRENRARMQTTVDEANANERIDPDRWFSNRSTFSQIMLVIGQVLSGGLQGLGGNTSSFDNMLKRMQDVDATDQQRQIQRREQGRNNQLAMFTEQWGGDVEAGKAALKLAQNQLIDKQIAAYAASTKNEDVALRSQEWLAQRELENAKLEQQLYVSAMGGGQEMTQVVNEEVVQPRAASAGRAPTVAERYHRGKELTGLRAGVAGDIRSESGAPSPDASARWGHQQQQFDTKQVTEYGEKKTGLADAKTELNDLASKAGATIDWKTGKVTAPTGDIPGQGYVQGALPRIVLSQKGRDVRRSLGKAVSAYRKSVTGVAFSPKEAEEAAADTFGRTDTDLIHGLQDMVTKVNARERSIEGEYLPDVRRAHEANQQDVNINRVVPTTKVKPY